MDNITGLSLGRIVIGAGMLLAPQKALRAGLMDATAPQSPYLARMFGSREIALGALTLMAPPEHRPTLVRAGVAVDVADAAAGVLAGRSPGHGPVRGAALTAAAAAAVAVGVASLRGTRPA
jgi:hypothetical protein